MAVLLFRRIPFTDGRWFAIVAGTAFWIQAIATAYKRCYYWDASKYSDLWSMLLIILCSSLYFLGRSIDECWRFLTYPITAVWLTVCIYGMLDRAVNILPLQIYDKRAAMMEMENNAREYLATGNPVYLQRKLPFQNLEVLCPLLNSKSIRDILPSNLLNPNRPLVPLKQSSDGAGFVQGGSSGRTPALDKVTIGSYGKAGAHSKNGITLLYNVPQGTRQVDLQVAGYPNATGMGLSIEERHKASHNIAPPFDPGDNWQTISVSLDPKSTFFEITAKDQSERAWLAFSMPVVSNDRFPSRLAKSLASSSFYFLDFGLVLLLLGGAGEIANGYSGETAGTGVVD